MNLEYTSTNLRDKNPIILTNQASSGEKPVKTTDENEETLLDFGRNAGTRAHTTAVEEFRFGSQCLKERTPGPDATFLSAGRSKGSILPVACN
ncbi:hypothetical protein BaRGS_00039704 [Batillaria attramentaria]|uniref:Uncharacterized protein n=1 Tax=Batillaria attramentaria TaxID=370345 RepID=A0ABD0J2P4_9CAEN